MTETPDHAFGDIENARNYAKGGPRNAVPGFDAMHRMTGQVLAESAGENAEILVLGAGGGLEIGALSKHKKNWSFIAVDPSPQMIQAAKESLRETAHRAEWIEGVIDDAPAGPFDGAICLLTLHIIPDDGSKLSTLRAIKQRIKPGSRFVVVDHCLPDDENRPMRTERYKRFFLESGAPEELVERITKDMLGSLNMPKVERQEELLSQAGFKDIDLIFAGFAWRGWAATA